GRRRARPRLPARDSPFQDQGPGRPPYIVRREGEDPLAPRSRAGSAAAGASGRGRSRPEMRTRSDLLYHLGRGMQRKRQRLQTGQGQPVTMKEIGGRAGVSQSTVSRILTGVEGSVRIPEETRERVFQAVRDLDSRPNPLAGGLRGARTAMIGLVVR